MPMIRTKPLIEVYKERFWDMSNEELYPDQFFPSDADTEIMSAETDSSALSIGRAF